MSNLDTKALVGQTLGNNDGKATYIVQELVSANALYTTYQAAHTMIHLKVMIKVFDPSVTSQADFAERFKAQIKALLDLNVPSIVKVFDYGSEQSYFNIVIEYHKSPPLASKLAEEKRLPLPVAIDYGRSLADALGSAAAVGVFHGSLSPHSITISSKRGPLLNDLGLAMLIDTRSLAALLAADRNLIDYAAPEVLRGSSPDALSDQYSLAAIVYEMASGQPPYQSLSSATTAEQHMTAPIPNIAALDPALSVLAPVLMRALAKDAAQRYPNFGEFNQALALALRIPVQGAAVSAPPPAPLPTPKPAAPAPAPSNSDRTMPEISAEDLRRQLAAAMPPALPPQPAAPAPAPSNSDRTMPEISAEDLRRQLAAAMPPTPPKPAAPAPAPSNSDRTMPEISAEDLRRQLAAAMPPAPPPQPAVPTPARPPIPPVRPPAPSNSDRTMPEMSRDSLRPSEAAFKATPQNPPHNSAQNMDGTMPEMQVPSYPSMPSYPPQSAPLNSMPPRPIGSQSTIPHSASDAGASTAWMNRDEMRKEADSSGITAYISRAPTNPQKQNKSSRGPSVLVIGLLLLVVLIIVAVVAVFVLRAAGILAF